MRYRSWSFRLAIVALLLIGGGAIWWSGGWWSGSRWRTGDPAATVAAGRADFRFTDDVGRTVAIRKPVRRVVIFNRYDVEFVRAIAGTGPIMGIDAGTAKERAYWPGLERVAVVGQGQSTPNYDAIVDLAPDLVLIPRNGSWAEADRILAPLGIPVAVMTAWDVLKHEENVTLLGRIFDRPDEAARLNAFYRKWRDLLAVRLKGVERKRVYLEEVGEYRTLLPGSGWHDMIETGGGLNIFRDVAITGANRSRGTVQGFTVDPEEVIARAPDAILKLQPGQYEPHPRAFSAGVLERIAARPGFDAIPAVRSGQVYHISYYLAGGCSKIVGALQIAKWLYPDRFRDVEPEAVMAEWLTRFQHVPARHGYNVSLAEVRR
ncbi:ABC transporter substrate-binding protein [Sphingobium sufflavum]|uniref:ABC transporter substrate-binding protein n=1 Tax=Sphingobium sufflavum TaxID=1129547 RepID=UPI001F47D732|nr:ABC transporter substrate-binding protein [Sphingobium sufflavum]MCE7796183.1 ABC transporter substrate-binding protein [Sphingobium sufflavum]